MTNSEESVNKNDFREVTIPGDILEDDRVSDGAKIIYGKIARLSYKTGVCWASNRFLDGTKSGHTASRQIQELIKAGYLGSRTGEQGTRLLYICKVNSKVEATPRTENGEPPSPEMVNPHTTNGETPSPKVATEHLNKTGIENKEKETGASLPDDKPIGTKEDGAAVFQKARLFWNEKGLKPECRDIIMRCTDTSEILRTFQHYTWEEIRNAIGNYHWHKTKAGTGYVDPPPYGSLAGFLKTGVERYFDDDALDQQFKESK
jgi:hypothetical protein